MDEEQIRKLELGASRRGEDRRGTINGPQIAVASPLETGAIKKPLRHCSRMSQPRQSLQSQSLDDDIRASRDGEGSGSVPPPLPLTVATTMNSLRPEAKGILKRLKLPATQLLEASRAWCLYNDGRSSSRARHAFLHARFELRPSSEHHNQAHAAAVFITKATGRDHMFLRYDMTAYTQGEGEAPVAVFQEHWSETDPSGPEQQYSGYLEAVPSRPWTRAELKDLIAAEWGRNRTYRDEGVDSDLVPGCRGSNNCISFAFRMFELLTDKGAATIRLEERQAADDDADESAATEAELQCTTMAPLHTPP